MNEFEVLSARGRFNPLGVGHPGVGQPYLWCGELMVEGQVAALVNLRPADAEEAARAAQGRAHTVEAGLVHEACAYPDGLGDEAAQP